MSGAGRRPRRTPLDPARRAAFDVLRAVSTRDAYANLALPAILRERGISGRDAAFATELAYGTCRARGLLDAVIAAAAGRPVDRIDPVLLDLLRLGAYQLLRTRVEDHAAVSTTVEQAGIEFDSARAGFVNGVLRAIARRDEGSWVAELAPPAATDPVGHLAFTHAHPRWIGQAFTDALGARAGELEALLASDDARPEVHLVVRPGRLSAAELAEATGGTVGRYSPYAVYLGDGDPGALPAVRDGSALVQDEGSQLIARALTLATLDGDDTGRWLDLCAGPGGKTALLASLGEPVGAFVDAVEPARAVVHPITGRVPRRSGRAEHRRATRHRPPRRRARAGPAARLRPGPRRCSVHRAGRAAPTARSPLAAPARRRARPGEAATRTAGLGDPAHPPGRGCAVRDVLAASGRNGRRRRRRAAPVSGDRPGHRSTAHPGHRHRRRAVGAVVAAPPRHRRDVRRRFAGRRRPIG